MNGLIGAIGLRRSPSHVDAALKALISAIGDTNSYVMCQISVRSL